jgi:hypothetical protein
MHGEMIWSLKDSSDILRLVFCGFCKAAGRKHFHLVQGLNVLLLTL